MKTQLNNGVLWYDGSYEIDSADIMQYINLPNICVNHLTDELIKYNKLVEHPITVKSKIGVLDTSWNIPDQYLTLDVDKYITEKLVDVCVGCTDNEFYKRFNRVKYELNVYKSLNLLDLLRTMVYIIDTYKKHNVVWGVGRGSSVSSYILYLLEVHDIDSVLYGLEFSEFLDG